MEISKKSLLAAFTFLLSCNLLCQLKYVGENRGALSLSGSYGKIGTSDIFGSQFDYSINGKVGVGLNYIHNETQPRGDGVGFQIEYAITRPKNTVGIGINVLGSFATTWAHTTYATPYYSIGYGWTYSSHETTVRGNAFIVGGELYLHTEENMLRVEPFVQFARTFSKVSSANLSESHSGNSMGIGTDLIIKISETNLVVVIPGVVFQEQMPPSLIGSISFCHTIK